MRWWNERGSASAETVFMTPVLVALLLFIVAAGRLAGATLQVNDASHASARAATIARDASTATADARTAAQDSLADRKVECQDVAVSVDTGSFQPGGTVAATVRCTVSLRELAMIQLPGAVTVSARSTEVIDYWRSSR